MVTVAAAAAAVALWGSKKNVNALIWRGEEILGDNQWNYIDSISLSPFLSFLLRFISNIDRSIDRSKQRGALEAEKRKKKRTSALLFGKFTTVYLSRFPRLSHMWHSLFLLFLFCLPLTSNNFVFILFCTLKPAKKGIKIRLCKLIINNFCGCKIFITASIKLFISLRQKI